MARTSLDLDLGQFVLMSVNHSARSGDIIIRIYFRFYFNMNVCCVVLLESPHEGDSNKYIQYTILSI